MFRIFEFIYTYRLALLCTLPGLVVAPELYYSILKYLILFLELLLLYIFYFYFIYISYNYIAIITVYF